MDRDKGSLLSASVTIVRGRVIALRRGEMSGDGGKNDGVETPPLGRRGGGQGSLNMPTS